MAVSLHDNNREVKNLVKSGRVQSLSTNVLLGFPDEFISDQHKPDVDFTTSKIGGEAVRNDTPNIQLIIKWNIKDPTFVKKLLWNELYSPCRIG